MKLNERTLYLHIGLPKTGTSALQVFFARNAKELYRKGIRYPGVNERVGNEEMITSGNGARVARSAFLPQQGGGSDVMGIFERAMRVGDRDVLISSEFFAGWEAERHNELKKFAGHFGFTVKIIVYLRDQADIVVTHYFQNLKRRPGYVDIGGDNFGQFAREYVEKQKYLDFNDLLEMLSGIYGKSNVRARTTKRSAMVGGSLITDTLAALGIEDGSGLNTEVSKINPTPNQQEMYIRALMGMFHPTVPTSDRYLKVVSQIHGALGNPKEDANFFIEPAVVEDIRAQFAETNAKTCEQWFQGKSISEVFDRKTYGKKVKFDKESMNINTVIAVFGGMLVDVLGRLEKIENKERGQAS